MTTKTVTDDYTAHLVVLGGVDWNQLSARVPQLLPGFPVRQVSPGADPSDAYFEVGTGDDAPRHSAELSSAGTLLSDVGLMVRAPSPFNRMRTFTHCTAMYSVGTLGIVRALTDERFRDRNEEYVRDRFPTTDRFAVLSRILIAAGHDAVTPDWNEQVLYEWPEAT